MNQTKPDTEISDFERFKVCTAGIHTHVAELINLHTGSVDNEIGSEAVKPIIRPLLGVVILFLLTAHSIYGVEVEGNPIENWEHVSKPSMDVVMAKMSHFSSIVFARVYGYGEESMEAGLDYDLKMLLSFLSLFAAYYEMSLLQIMHDYCALPELT